MFFHALHVKLRDEGPVKNKSVYLTIGYPRSGHKEVVGIWIEQTEGAKFWIRVMCDLYSQGDEDILIAVIEAHKDFPKACIQTCIVHTLLYSMDFTSWKERKAIAQALGPTYRGEGADEARQQLEEFAAVRWGQKYPMIDV